MSRSRTAFESPAWVLNSEPAGRSSIGYTRDFCFYYGPDIIHHIPIQNQWRRPQNYPECQPSGAAILNARNQYWCRKILQKRFQKIFKKKVSSASRDDLQHQKLKLYLHFTKNSLEVIRINFVEIPWLVSLLKTPSFHIPRCSFHCLQRRFATHQRLDFTCIWQRKAWQSLWTF